MSSMECRQTWPGHSHRTRNRQAPDRPRRPSHTRSPAELVAMGERSQNPKHQNRRLYAPTLRRQPRGMRRYNAETKAFSIWSEKNLQLGRRRIRMVEYVWFTIADSPQTGLDKTGKDAGRTKKLGNHMARTSRAFRSTPRFQTPGIYTRRQISCNPKRSAAKSWHDHRNCYQQFDCGKTTPGQTL